MTQVSPQTGKVESRRVASTGLLLRKCAYGGRTFADGCKYGGRGAALQYSAPSADAQCRVPSSVHDVSGSAKFMENYTGPFTRKRVEASGTLRGTLQQPAGWCEAGSKYSYVGISDYFGCDNKQIAGKPTTEGLSV